MPTKHVLPALSALALLAATAGVSFAQDNQPGDVASYREIDDDSFVVEPWGLTVDQIDDMALGSASGNIGEIEEVLTDASGEAVAVSVDLDDDQGNDDDDVVVGLEQIRMEGQQLVTDLTGADAQALPRWDD